MELHGFKRCIAQLQNHGIEINQVITDRHVQMKKYIKENMPSVRHSFDVWHVVKSENVVLKYTPSCQ